MNPNEDDAFRRAVHSRAELLPEERAAGASVDPEAQAEAILRESEERVNAPHEPPDGELDPRPSQADEHEHRRSEDLV